MVSPPDPAELLAALPSAESMGMPQLTPADFRLICELAYQHFGVEIRPGKESLVTLRLSEPMRNRGFRELKPYLEYIIKQKTGPAVLEFIDALTTNHTNFMREPVHFDCWRQRILTENRNRETIPVWCAASSTGEEPYTLAMTAVEELGDRAFTQVRITATDISCSVLEQAKRGVYRADRLEPLPEAWRRRFFLKGEGRWQGYFRVKPALGKMIDYRWLNLIEPIPEMGPFAAIFCRNVMIYFNAATRAAVVEKLVGRLEPGGYFIVGHAESLTGVDSELEYVQPAVYRARRGASAGHGGDSSKRRTHDSKR